MNRYQVTKRVSDFTSYGWVYSSVLVNNSLKALSLNKEEFSPQDYIRILKWICEHTHFWILQRKLRMG